jgi:hypothetical protein
VAAAAADAVVGGLRAAAATAAVVVAVTVRQCGVTAVAGGVASTRSAAPPDGPILVVGGEW